jgi:hypothetical protein
VHVATDYVIRSFRIHLGSVVFDRIAPPFQPIALGAAALMVFWIILVWMYRNRLFVRI